MKIFPFCNKTVVDKNVVFLAFLSYHIFNFFYFFLFHKYLKMVAKTDNNLLSSESDVKHTKYLFFPITGF